MSSASKLLKPDSARPGHHTFTVAGFQGGLNRRRREKHPATAVGGGIEQRVHVAGPGERRGRAAVPNDVGEGSTGSGASHVAELLALARPPIEQSSAWDNRALRDHRPASWGEGRGVLGTGDGFAAGPAPPRSAFRSVRGRRGAAASYSAMRSEQLVRCSTGDHVRYDG